LGRAAVAGAAQWGWSLRWRPVLLWPMQLLLRAVERCLVVWIPVVVVVVVVLLLLLLQQRADESRRMRCAPPSRAAAAVVERSWWWDWQRAMGPETQQQRMQREARHRHQQRRWSIGWWWDCVFVVPLACTCYKCIADMRRLAICARRGRVQIIFFHAVLFNPMYYRQLSFGPI